MMKVLFTSRAFPPALALRCFYSSSAAAAQRVASFSPTVFSEFTQLSIQHDAVNLGQGFPDWATPNFVKDAAISAIGSDLNQYTRSAGHPALVNELAVLYSAQFDRDLDAASNFVVTAGATEALFTTMQAFLNPGDEAILFEPFYDAYPSQVKMAGACVKSVALQPCPDSDLADDWVLDLNELEKAITDRTRLIVLNTPHNPLGKVFSRDELEGIADIVRRHKDLLVIVDEAYEWLTLPGHEHAPLERHLAVLVGKLAGPLDLVRFGGFAVSRIAPSDWVNDIVYRTTVLADRFDSSMDDGLRQYLSDLKQDLAGRCEILEDGLTAASFGKIQPSGGYFVTADISEHPFCKDLSLAEGESQDYAFCRRLIEEAGVGAIPVSAFYSEQHKQLAQKYVRFAFCKSEEAINEGIRRLKQI